MIRQEINKKEKLCWGIISIILILAAYTAMSYRQHNINPTDTTIPTWGQIWVGFQMIVTPDRQGDIWLAKDGLATMMRFATGIGIGSLAAACVGLGMGCFPRFAAFSAPPIVAFSKVPPTAMLAVYFVIFGMGFNVLTAIVALGIFPTMAASVYVAARDVPMNTIHKSYTLGASHAEVVLNVVRRTITPAIITNIQISIGPALVFLVAAEWIMADAGFGYRLRIQSRLLNMNVVYIYLMVLGVSGFLMDWTMTLLRRRMCPWYV